MFDIGFSELLLFGVIALVVLGPERLPHAARTAGRWYAKLRRTVSTLQNEIEAEFDLAETRQKMQEELAKIKQADADMKREMAELRDSMQEFEKAQNQAIVSPKAKASTVNSDNSDSDLYAYNTSIDQPATQPSISLENHLTQPDIKHFSQLQKFDNSRKQPITRPWAHMWFLLSTYDKVRRLPPPPLLPNYRADTLLNAIPATIPRKPDTSLTNNTKITDNTEITDHTKTIDSNVLQDSAQDISNKAGL